MKKILFVASLLLMSMVSVNVSAQDDNTAQQRPRREGGRQQMDPAKMIEMRVNQMTKKYGLDDKQKEQVTALMKEQMTPKKKDGEQPKVDFRNMTDEQRQAMKKEREERAAKFDAEMKKILTEEQYKQYTEDQKNRQNRGFGNGQRPQRPQRPPRQQNESSENI